MTDSDTDKRFSEASDLHRALESRCHVPSAERQLFFHDRLMSAIDDICKNQATAKQPFTNDQIKVLKEISFRIVYILDPMNKPQRGFIGALRREFGEKTAIGKLSSAAAAATFIAAAIGGVYTLSAGAYEYYQKSFVGNVQPAAAQQLPQSQQSQRGPSEVFPNLPMLTR